MKASFTQHWLAILCGSIANVHSALFVLPDSNNQSIQALAKWPQELADVNDFALIIQCVLAKNDSISVLNVQQADQSLCDFFAQPVFLNNELLGVIVVKVSASSEENHAGIFAALSQGGLWLALANNRNEQSQGFYPAIISILSACLEQSSYPKALITLVAELTQMFKCEQIALGEFNNHHAKIVALSNSANFDDKSNFIQKIADAMDEAIEQDCIIVFPDARSHGIQRAHQELARKFGAGAVLTLPMINNQTVVGAVTLLRHEDQPFDAESSRLCQLTLALITPFLALKKVDELNVPAKIRLWFKAFLSDLLGFKQLKLKLGVVGLLGLLGLSVMLPGEFQVTADAVLEGKIQRIIAAPIDGFLLAAAVRAGDTVHSGEVMAMLDNADLQLELNKLNGQLQKFRREYREALSVNDLVKIRVSSAQIDQATAEMALTRQQLQKITLTAPYDSVVIEGDLSQKLGSPVERGDLLFKIAPLEGYRIILKVDERLISYVNKGQKGVLALASIPDQKFDLSVENITAVAKADDNKNIFRVEASLLNPPNLLRPGMEGVGKITVGERRLLWIWTHELIACLRLWLWSWW
jgi:Barrel-sandwich domain of CusB or HlyD membrane-fusion/GAF domain